MQTPRILTGLTSFCQSQSMWFLLQSILVLFAGLLLGTSMIGWKSGRAFYCFGTDSRIVPPEAAQHYWYKATGQNPQLIELQHAGQAKRIVEDSFRRDLQIMEWTWGRELRWKNTPGRAGPVSGPSSQPPLTVP